jgi:hypothetical protein
MTQTTVLSSNDRLIATSGRNECPVCSDTTGKCRTTSTELVLCMNTTDKYSTPSGWSWRGLDKQQGLWGQIVPDLGSERKTRSDDWRLQREADRAAQEREKLALLATREQRDGDYQYKIANYPLLPIDRDDLIRRGLSDIDIATLKPFSRDDGYITPIRDINGLMVGGQVRKRHFSNDSRYIWATTGANKLPDTGELPLAHYFGSDCPTSIALPEGTGIKVYFAGKLLNALAIGAAGGNHASSPKTLKVAIDRYPDLPIQLIADAGAVLNPHVMKSYQKTYYLLKRWGRDLQVLWYEQITKGCGDIDEISPNTPTRLISWHEFEQIANSQQWRLMSILRCFGKSRQAQSVPVSPPTPVTHSSDRIYTTTAELESICTEAIETGIKYVLDVSVTGSGKSTTSASIRNVGGINRYFYITDTHRNPTTAAVETSFTDIPSRHNGLYVNPHKLTPLGHPYLQTSQPADEKLEMTAGNCHLADLHNSLRGKGYEIDGDDNPICMTCPLVGACTHSSGSGFGYKFKRRSALAEGRLRCSPSSLPHPDGFDYQGSLSIWDDTRIQYSNEIVATTNDFDRTLAQLSTANPELLVQLQPLTAKLRAMFNGERRAKFGFSHAEIMDGVTIPNLDSLLAATREILTPNLSELVEAPDGIDTTGMSAKDKKKWRSSIANVNRSFRGQTKRSNISSIDSMPSNWLVRLLETIGNDKGYFRFDRGALVVTIPDDYHRSIVRVSKLNLFLDATHNREDLALELGVTPAEILVISQPVPTYDNLKISLVTGMGNPTKDRRDSMQDRLDALGQTLRDRHHGNIAIIDKVRSPDSGLWYRDSRGTNAYKDCEALVLIGSPVPNLGSLSAQFSILVGRQIAPTSDDPEFKAYINRQIVAETIQGVGRLRAQHQPDKQLTIYWVCERADLPVDRVVAAYPNCQHDRVAGLDICLQTGTTTQQLHHTVARTLLKFGAMTREKLANLTNVSPAALTKYFSQLGHNFKVGSHLLLKALYSKCDLFKSTTDKLPNSILADWENLNVADVVELVEEVLRNPDATVLEKAETVVAVVGSLPPRQLRGLFVRLGEVLTLQLIDLIRLSLVNELEAA